MSMSEDKTQADYVGIQIDTMITNLSGLEKTIAVREGVER